MKAGEMFKKLREEKKLTTLILMLLCGAALIGLSFLLAPQEESAHDSADLTYASAGVEARLNRVMSQIAGAGNVEVLVMEDDEGIRGVLIVADGAQELTVRTELMRAAMTALDIPASSVEVFARQEEKEETK